jgi:oxygen-independent coproporphyrinogen-3 oxidase
LNQDLAPLGVYLHWPYCARICPYCDFNIYRDRGRGEEQSALLRAMLDDLTAQRRLTGPRRLVSIFFGGGTPSLMKPEAVAQLVDHCRKLWSAEPDLEISLEANPTDAEADRFSALAEAGVQRLSLGVQSLDDAELKFLGRNHGADEALRAAQLAGRTFARLSVDLIYALPGQTAKGWTDALTRIADLGAEHVSPYQLTIEEGTAFDRAVRRGRFALADQDLAGALYDVAQSVLEAHGFDAYEVSNHARGAAARSRHNLVYWRGEDYVGAGPGAHGRLTLEGLRTATTAHAIPADYIRAVAEAGTGFADTEALDPVARAEERLLMGLRIDEGVAWSELNALHLTPASQVVARLAQLGLVRADPARLSATRPGRRVLDAVIRDLVLS